MSGAAARLPTADDIRNAAARIAPHAVVTPILRSEALDALVGASVYFKAEHLQKSGAFKFRGACNAVWSLTDAKAARGVVTHSSGNHGNALAMAAASRGIPAHVVVPEGAMQSKVDAIGNAGATLYRCAPTQAAREVIAAMKLIWQHLKQVVEPSSATVLAAMLRYRRHFVGRRIGVVLSGGNVDLDALPW